MSFFNTMNISASGLTAQRVRMDTIAENIANVNTTRTADGGPYQRKTVVFEEIRDNDPFSLVFTNIFGNGGSVPAPQGMGVRVAGIWEDDSPGLLRFEPTHPDADELGYVRLPNVNIVTEMVNMIAASRSYEANITAMGVARTMTQRTLEIGQGR
ncbi:MAG: flagellar basal body rod protein FlgC [Defluviitaleaceae bacterium]|nr:flagellar basal body rod protein FlgC [Defluviitaleaceae bacterium]MCL2261780.1 flagellar basal body rod protein FlgC [Defluviitaleaceae bacterium]